MCRIYTITNSCNHTYTTRLSCPLDPHHDATPAPIIFSNPDTCTQCLTNTLSFPSSSPFHHSTLLLPHEQAYTNTLWTRISALTTEYEESRRNGRAQQQAQAPFENTLLPHSDVQFLLTNLRLLRVSCLGTLDREERTRRGLRVVTPTPTPTTPNLLPISVTDMSPDRHSCIICSIKFGERADDGTIEHALRFPCHRTHVIGSECVKEFTKYPDILGKCPWCNTRFDLGNYRLVEREVRSPWWMRRLRGE